MNSAAPLRRQPLLPPSTASTASYTSPPTGTATLCSAPKPRKSTPSIAMDLPASITLSTGPSPPLPPLLSSYRVLPHPPAGSAAAYPFVPPLAGCTHFPASTSWASLFPAGAGSNAGTAVGDPGGASFFLPAGILTPSTGYANGTAAAQNLEERERFQRYLFLQQQQQQQQQQMEQQQAFAYVPPPPAFQPSFVPPEAGRSFALHRPPTPRNMLAQGNNTSKFSSRNMPKFTPRNIPAPQSDPGSVHSSFPAHPKQSASSTSSSGTHADGSQSRANPGNTRPTLLAVPPNSLRPEANLKDIVTEGIANRKNIYLRGLPPDMTDEALRALCEPYGRVLSTKAIVDQAPVQLPTGEVTVVSGICKGYGFAMFDSHECAQTAITELRKQGYQVALAKESFSSRLKSLQDDNSTNLYISNLPPLMTIEEVNLIFESRSLRVMSSRLMLDDDGMGRGVGFARLETRPQALRAIQELNGLLLPGCILPLQLRFADNNAQKKLKSMSMRRQTDFDSSTRRGCSFQMATAGGFASNQSDTSSPGALSADELYRELATKLSLSPGSLDMSGSRRGRSPDRRAGMINTASAIDAALPPSIKTPGTTVGGVYCGGIVPSSPWQRVAADGGSAKWKSPSSTVLENDYFSSVFYPRT